MLVDWDLSISLSDFFPLVAPVLGPPLPVLEEDVTLLARLLLLPAPPFWFMLLLLLLLFPEYPRLLNKRSKSANCRLTD